MRETKYDIYNHIPLDQEWKLSILHELLKAKEDNFVLNNFNDRDRNHDQLFMFRLETIFIYYTLFLFLSYHILPFYLCVRNKSIIIIIIYKKWKQSHPLFNLTYNIYYRLTWYNHEHQKTYIINSVESSLNSHPLC